MGELCWRAAEREGMINVTKEEVSDSDLHEEQWAELQRANLSSYLELRADVPLHILPSLRTFFWLNCCLWHNVIINRLEI